MKGKDVINNFLQWQATQLHGSLRARMLAQDDRVAVFQLDSLVMAYFTMLTVSGDEEVDTGALLDRLASNQAAIGDLMPERDLQRIMKTKLVI